MSHAVARLEAFNFEFGNFVGQWMFQKCADFALFKVLTAVLMKIQVFPDVKPCRLVNNCGCFGGTCCLCLQDDGIISTWTLQTGGKTFLWNVGVHTILTWCEIAEVRHLILKTSIDVHRKKEPWVFDAAMCNIKFSSSGTVSVAPDSRSSGTLFLILAPEWAMLIEIFESSSQPPWQRAVVQ